MSLAPKIDEIPHAVQQQNIDIALFTETWLKDSIPDDSINIEGFQLYRRDRTAKTKNTAASVCMLKTRFSVRYCRTFTVTTKKPYGPS